MRILVVSNVYPPHGYGGYELSCQDVVERWRAKGHEVEVLTTTTHVDAVDDDPTETGVHRELEWYWHEHELLRPRPLERLRIERRNVARLRTRLDTYHPDVVSMWAMGGMSMSLISCCAARRQPLALIIEDEWLGYGPKVDAWTDAWSRRPAWQAALGAQLAGVATTAPVLPPSVAVAFASTYLRDRAEQAGSIRFAWSTVVPLGVDTATFPPQPADDHPWRGRLLCAGRIEPRKGFDTAVRAVAELPDVTLRVVGPGEPGEVERLRDLIEALDLADRVQIEPTALPRGELVALYRDADAVVFPSRWQEPFGLVPLEAMTQATPVIATRQGGSADFLRDGVNCLAVVPDDPAAIAAAVRRLTDDADLRRHLVSGGLVTAAGLTVDRFADSLEHLHRRAIGDGSLPVVDVLDQVSTTRADHPDPEIAVVVSTYNRGELIDGLLDALEQQDHPDFEVIVADNGSTDDTWARLTGRAASTTLTFAAIRIAPQGGPGIPRNTAVDLIRAPMLAFTDDDCLPEAGWLSAMARHLADPGVTVVQGQTIPEEGVWLGPWSRSVEIRALTGYYETANLGCRRDDFIAAGGFSRHRLLSGRAFGEDTQLGTRLANSGRPEFAADAQIRHRIMSGDYRTFLAERRRLSGFPTLLREVPEVRDQLLGGIFLNRRTVTVDVAVVGALAAAASRSPWPLIAALPWAARSWRAGARRPGRPQVVRAAQIAVGDAVGLAALVRGSIAARRVVL